VCALAKALEKRLQILRDPPLCNEVWLKAGQKLRKAWTEKHGEPTKINKASS
jgi:hypothetical protein